MMNKFYLVLVNSMARDTYRRRIIVFPTPPPSQKSQKVASAIDPPPGADNEKQLFKTGKIVLYLE